MILQEKFFIFSALLILNIILILLLLLITLFCFFILKFFFKENITIFKKDLTAISSIIQTIILFTLSKNIVQDVFPLYYFFIVPLGFFILNQFLKKEWDKILFESYLFKYYITTMLQIETMFSSSFFFQFIANLVFFQFFFDWLNLKSQNFDLLGFENIILLVVIVYIKLRIRFFTIKDLVVEPVIQHEVDSKKVEEYFKKILGVHLKINKEKYSNLHLFSVAGIKVLSLKYLNNYLKHFIDAFLPLLFLGLLNRDLDIGSKNHNTSYMVILLLDERLSRLRYHNSQLLKLNKDYIQVSPHQKEYILTQIKDLHNELVNFHIWMSSQNYIFYRSFVGPISNMRYYKEQVSTLTEKIDNLDIYLSLLNLVKSDMINYVAIV